jgi:hypothetical protein
MHNKSEPTWDWEDEQGFSALRHSGETNVTQYPISQVWSWVNVTNQGSAFGSWEGHPLVQSFNKVAAPPHKYESEI